MIHKKIKYRFVFIGMLTLGIMYSTFAECQPVHKEKSFADQWEFIGTAVEEPGYTIWGTSPIWGDDGKVHLFVARWPCELKVDPGWRTHSEIAHYVGDSPEGPYVQLPFPVTSNDRNIEDGFAFFYKGKFALLTTDNHGIIESGGGILWTSEDGIRFTHYEKGFHRINQYTPVDMGKVAVHYGPQDREYAKFERPQVLLREGKPGYLYVPSGTNIYGEDCTVSYVLKFKNSE